MIKITSNGRFKKTNEFLNRLLNGDAFSDFDRYGQLGVDALSRATPVNTGRTASDWGYEVVHDDNGHGIRWFNTNVVGGVPLVILLQYGHGTGTGGYVEGRDFINPAMRPVFDQIANEVWKKVTAS